MASVTTRAHCEQDKVSGGGGGGEESSKLIGTILIIDIFYSSSVFKFQLQNSFIVFSF